jgi:hypothetical protein
VSVIHSYMSIFYMSNDYVIDILVVIFSCRLKMKEIRRITSELKPALTAANERARVEYALKHLEPCSLTSLGGIKPTFRADMDVVHIDEKWFYRTRKTQNMYLSHRENAPHRECKHKNHIQKIMFLSAMARPRYDAQGNCVFDGKIGVWAYTEMVQAQKKSQNRSALVFVTTPTLC